MKEFTMRLQQQIRLFLVLSVIVLWTQSVYSDVYYVASSPAFTAPKAHIWNSSDDSHPMHSWNSSDEAMTSVGTATDGSTIYSYTYNGAYNKIIIHDDGSYQSITLDYLNNYFYRRYPVGDGTYWWKLCASSNVEMNISTDGSRNRVDFSAGSGYTLIAKVSLNASTIYQFKLHQKTEGDNNGWWGNNGSMTSTNCTNWNMTDGSNDCHLTTTVAGTYTFLYDYSTDQLSVLYPGANIAQGKTDKSGWSRRGSCPNQNGTETPDKSFDGNTGTKWVSYACNDLSKTWIAVDLGRAYRLSGLSTVWGWTADNTPSHYKVQVMTSTPSDFTDDVAVSDNNWTTVLEVRETQQFGTDKENVYSLGAVKGRYVRLVSLDKTEIGLNELKIYAEQFAETPDVTPTMGSASLYSDYSSGSLTLTLTATDHSGNALNTFLLQDNYGIYYRVTTDGSDHATLSGLSAKRYIFTVWAIEEGNLSVGSQTVVAGEGTFSSSTNLALNKPTYAYGYTGTNYIRNANDGTLDNFWSLAQPIPAADQDHVWWYVDLQDEYVLKSLSLYWEGAFANSFIWQIRKYEPTSLQADDDSAWETFLDYQGDQTAGTSESNCNLYGDTTGYKAKFSITPKGRYVRFRAKGAANWDWGVKLREVRIYGSAYLPLDDEAPVITAASYNGVTADYTGIKFNVTATDNSGLPVTEYIVIDPEGTSYKTRASAGVVTVTGMPTFKDENVTFYAIDSAANKSVAYVVEDVSYVTPNENLALEKTAVGCTTYQDSQSPAKAVDGNLETNWTSYAYGTTNNEWWYVDLGDFYSIRRIEVVWLSDYASANYSVQYRQNAPANNSGAKSSEWDAISEFTNVTAGNKSADLAGTVEARYICLRSTAHGSTHTEQNMLAEFRVFGKGYGTPDNDEPEWTRTEINAAEHTLTLNLAATDANPENIYNYVINVDNGTTDKDYECTTAAENDEITITDAAFIYACHTYTVTAKCYDHVGNEATHTFSDIIPSLDAETNVFSGATATADAGTASVAINGITGDRWASGISEPNVSHWIQVDIGEVREVNTLKIAWETACPKDYYIEGSADGTNYYPLLHETEAPAYASGSFSDYDTYTLEDGVGVRYVKVRSVTNNTQWGMSIWEMQAYGACYEEDANPVATFARVASQVTNGTNTAINATIEVGAFDYTTTYGNMRYKVSYAAEGGSATVLDNQTATSGQLTLSGLAFSTNYSVTVWARDAVDGNLSDNSVTVNFTTPDKQPSFYFRNSMNWQDGGLSQDYRFAYVSAGSDVMRFTTISNNNALQYRLYDDVNNDGAVENPTETDKWSRDGNQYLNGSKDKSFTVYAKDQDHYVSTLDLVYVVGSSVKATEANAWQMTQSGTTYFWEGVVTAGNKYKIIVKAQETEGIANAAFTDNSRTRIMADSATFTNSEGYTYARLTFDMATWTCTWSEAHFVIYHKDDKADDPRATSGHAESYAGGTISGVVEYRMKVHALDQWYSLCLPFDVDAVKVWDKEDGAYYDIYPYYRDNGTYIAWHYIIRTPETAANLSLERFGYWNDPTSKDFLPRKNTPYIIQWHDEYFEGRYISFFGHDATIPTSMTVGTAPASDNVVNVYGNDAMVNGTVRDAYLLDGEYGQGAWLREEIGTNRTILPFECYLLASSTTASRFMAMRPNMNIPDTATAFDEAVRNAEQQTLITVYTISGQLIGRYSNQSVAQVGQTLAGSVAEGLYILHTDSECVKLLIGGK